MRRTHKKLQRLNPICQASSHKYAQSAEIPFPSEHALSIHASRDFINCQGKCQECHASGSPCDLTRSTGPCSTCRSSGKPCQEPKSSNRSKVWQCTKCLCRFLRNPHPEKDCMGRCVHCVEDDLPCQLKYPPGPNQSIDCIFCLQERKECIRPHTEDSVLAEDEMGESSK